MRGEVLRLAKRIHPRLNRHPGVQSALDLGASRYAEQRDLKLNIMVALWRLVNDSKYLHTTNTKVIAGYPSNWLPNEFQFLAIVSWLAGTNQQGECTP